MGPIRARPRIRALTEWHRLAAAIVVAAAASTSVNEPVLSPHRQATRVPELAQNSTRGLGLSPKHLPINGELARLLSSTAL